MLALRLSKLTKYHNIIQAERNLEGKEREEQIVEKAVEMAGATKMLKARVPKKRNEKRKKTRQESIIDNLEYRRKILFLT